MIDLDPGRAIAAQLERVRWLGREFLRPLGIEADRRGTAIPADHPFFQTAWDSGIGQLRLDDAEERPRGERTAARRGVLLAEEMAYWDRGAAVALPGPGLGEPPVRRMGTPEQRARLLGPFRDPSRPRWAAFAMTEPGAGSDVAAIRTSARRDGDGWVLRGAKTFISNAIRADWIVVWATVDPAAGRAGHRAFVVERGTPGLEDMRAEHKMGLIAYESASFTLRDCRVPAANLLGGEEHYQSRAGFKGAMASFNATRPAIAVMAVGIARAAYDAARDFARANYALARPIPRYHRFADKLARIARKIEAARLLCWRAATLADAEVPNQVEASMAKAFAPAVAQEATGLALEVLGDAGVLRDRYVEKLYRDVKAMDIVEGTGQVQRIVIARRLLGYPAES
jgi:acyl-CoA dehydrogenase